MSDQERQKLLNNAEQALVERNLENARQLYETVQAKWPDDPTARQKMIELKKLEDADERIRDLYQQAEDVLAQHDYKKAQQLYESARNHAGQHGIQKYLVELESKRNRAFELERDLQRIEEGKTQVQALITNQDRTAALKLIDELLLKIPPEEHFLSSQSSLEDTRRQLLEQGSNEQKYNEAQDAFLEDRYQAVLELVKTISPDYFQYREVEKLRRDAQDAQTDIIKGVERVENAINRANPDWGAAFAELEELRKRFPKNPEWRQKWLQIGKAHGLQELEAGRQANSDRNFKQAEAHFQKAYEAFSKILEVYTAYPDAEAWQDTAKALREIAAQEQQAEKDWQAGRRQDALSALQGAQKILTKANAAGREEVTVATTVKAMITAVEAELDRIEREASALKDGERLLDTKHPDEAAEKFRSALNALLRDTQLKAADGLNRAEEVLRLFEADKQAEQSASDAQEAVKRLRAAYERWPTGPDIARLLEERLVETAKEMRAKGNRVEAAKYAQEALQLNPGNADAGHIKEWAGLEPTVTAELESVDKDLASLKQQPGVQAKDFQPIWDRLQQLLSELGSKQKTLSQRVTAKRDEVKAQQERWQAYETTYQQALTASNDGRWPDAVTQLENALQLLGQEAPRQQQQQLAVWRQTLATIAEEEPNLMNFWQAAQSAYDEAPQTGKYDTPLTILNNAAKAWQRLEKSIEQSGGSYPADLITLQTQLQRLRERVELALEAFTSPVARDGLVKIEAYSRRQGTDPTLTALEQELREKVKAQIPQLRSQADIAEQTGDLTEALDLLRQANALEPGNKEIEQQFVRLQKRQKQEERLQAVLADYQRKLATNSFKDASKSLREGLEIFLEPDAGLPTEAENRLRQLIQMVAHKGENAFADAANWDEAQKAFAQFTFAVQESMLGKRALQILNLWLDASRSQALRTVAISTAIIEDKLKGHRAARKLLEDEPLNPDFIQQFNVTKQMVMDSLNESASHRLQRAREALDKEGDYEAAIVEATRVENEIYSPPEREFEGFFAGEQEVAKNRVEAGAIVRKANSLREKDERVRSFYNAARDDYAQNNLAETEKQLNQIGDISGLPNLEKEIKELRDKLDKAIEDGIRQRLQDELTAANVDLSATDKQLLSQRLNKLKAFPTADLTKLPKADRDAHQAMIDQIETRILELEESGRWYSDGQEALAGGQYEKAVRYLQRALAAVPKHDSNQKINIQKSLDAAEEAHKQQKEQAESATRALKEQEESASRARKWFSEGKYNEAQQELNTAKSKGADVSQLLNATQAAIVLQQAKQAYEQRKHGEAESYLHNALSKAQGNPEAEIILVQITVLQELVVKLKQKIEQEAESARQKEEAAQKQAEAEAQVARQEKETAQKRADAEAQAARQRAAVEAEEKKKREEAEAKAKKEQAALERERQNQLNKDLRAAKKELTDGNFDVAQQKVDAILDQDPAHEDAQKLENEIARARRAREMWQEAKAAFDRRNYAQAESLLKTIQESILPGYVPAVTLQTQIETERPIIEQLQRAEQLAYSHAFDSAREVVQSVKGASPQQIQITVALISKLQLERAERLVLAGMFQEARSLVQSVAGADEEQLKRVQDLIAAEEAKIIEPIEQDLLDENFTRALDRCRTALAQTSSPDIQEKLQELQSNIVERRATYEMNVLRQQIKQSRDWADLDAVVSRLDWLLAQQPRPIPFTYTELKKLRYNTLARQLRGQMEQAELLYQQDAFPDAISLFDAIATNANLFSKEADDLGRELAQINNQAAKRKIAIERKQQIIQQHEMESVGRELLAQAEAALAKAQSRLDLERAERLAKQVLEMPFFKENDTVNALQKRATTALTIYDKTKQAVKLSKEQVGLRRYEPAETALRLSHEPSPLLQEIYDRQRNLARDLRQAERAQYDGAWEKALEHFAVIIKKEPNLELHLESDLERCRRQVMETKMTQAQQALFAVPPDWQKAHTLLANMKEQIWFTSTYATQAEGLLNKANSYQWLAKAIEQLRKREADLTEARASLKQARDLLPEEEDQELASWELLLDAAIIWREQADWQQAESLLVNLDGATADLPFTRSLLQEVQTARANAEAKDRQQKAAAEKAEQLRIQLVGQQKQMQSALVQADYDQVVNLVQQAHELDARHSITIAMKQASCQHLWEKAQEQQKLWQYGQAIQLGQYLEKLFLNPDEPDFSTALAFARSLGAQRKQALEAAINRADAALLQYDAVGAEQAIHEAETIHAPAPGHAQQADDRLTQLNERLRQARDKIAGAESSLSIYRQQRQAKELVEARNALQRAANQAPGYAPVKNEIAEFQAFLAKQARDKLPQAAANPRVYTDALHLCEIGLSLDDTHFDLSNLQNELTEARNKHWQELLQKIRQALQSWDLENANRFLDQAVQLFAIQSARKQVGQTSRSDLLQFQNFAMTQIQFNELRDLSVSFEQKQSRVGQIKEDMEIGLNLVHARDYAGAGQAFARVRTTAPDFDEARLWQSYATNMGRVVEHVQADSFQQAMNVLQATDPILRLPEEAKSGGLPSVLGSVSRLRRERRQAVYDAARLQAPVQELLDLSNKKDRLAAGADYISLQEAANLRRKILERRKAFVSFYQDRATPPDSFDAAVSATTSAPVATTFAPTEATTLVNTPTRRVDSIKPRIEESDPVLVTEPETSEPYAPMEDASWEESRPTSSPEHPDNDFAETAVAENVEDTWKDDEAEDSIAPPVAQEQQPNMEENKPPSTPSTFSTEITDTNEAPYDADQTDFLVLDPEPDHFKSRLSNFFSEQLPDEQGE